MKKLFISHASEDKDDFVRRLAEALLVDFDVWYDDYELVVGHSLLEEISKGLANCDFGVVVLSKHFFAKNWPQQELNGLFGLEEKDKKIILPVWKGVSKDEVRRYSPILADRVAAKAEEGVDKVVKDLRRAIAFLDRGKSDPVPRRSEMMKKIGEILRESGPGPKSYRKEMMLLLHKTGDVKYRHLKSECYKPPYSEEMFLVKWRSLLRAHVMEAEGGLNPRCRLTDLARSVLDDISAKQGSS